jgi:hypothetical protein
MTQHRSALTSRAKQTRPTYAWQASSTLPGRRSSRRKSLPRGRPDRVRWCSTSPGLGFIDSTGLRCILDLDAESRLDGFSIALIQGPPAVRRVFELTNTDTLLRFIQP